MRSSSIYKPLLSLALKISYEVIEALESKEATELEKDNSKTNKKILPKVQTKVLYSSNVKLKAKRKLMLIKLREIGLLGASGLLCRWLSSCNVLLYHYYPLCLSKPGMVKPRAKTCCQHNALHAWETPLSSSQQGFRARISPVAMSLCYIPAIPPASIEAECQSRVRKPSFKAVRQS